MTKALIKTIPPNLDFTNRSERVSVTPRADLGRISLGAIEATGVQLIEPDDQPIIDISKLPEDQHKAALTAMSDAGEVRIADSKLSPAQSAVINGNLNRLPPLSS